jgi:hypothetical protein
MQCILYKIYFLESFSHVLQFDMHFYMHSYVDKNFILVKSGCYTSFTFYECNEWFVKCSVDA